MLATVARKKTYLNFENFENQKFKCNLRTNSLMLSITIGILVTTLSIILLSSVGLLPDSSAAARLGKHMTSCIAFTAAVQDCMANSYICRAVDCIDSSYVGLY